jgi:hypothetical protein
VLGVGGVGEGRSELVEVPEVEGMVVDLVGAQGREGVGQAVAIGVEGMRRGVGGAGAYCEAETVCAVNSSR